MVTGEDIQAFEYYTPSSNRQKAHPGELVEYFINHTGQEPSVQLYANLVWEEWLEFADARSEENRLKELTDILYVSYGLIYSAIDYAEKQGWDIAEAFLRVHENNLARVTQPDGSIKRREDGKILKIDNPPKVILSDLLTKQRNSV